MKRIVPFLLIAALMLSACNAADDRKEVVLETEEESTTGYEQVMVERMNVVNSISVSLSYNATQTIEYSFSTKNAIVEFVYVKRGDRVSKGQVLATLESEDLENTISTLQHELDGEELSIKQAKESEALEIETEEYLFGYTKGSDEDIEARDKAIENIKKRYESTIQSINDRMVITKMKLEAAKKEYANSRIISTVDGVVSFCKSTLEGSMVVPDEKVIRVYDDSECLFSSTETFKGEYFKEGEIYELTVGTGSAERLYHVKPVRMSDWDSYLYFEPIDGLESLSVNDYGKITVVVDEVDNALAIPIKALHSSKSKRYVYYLDTDGIRRMKYVTVGLVGTEYAEIKEGLAEGEYIILK